MESKTITELVSFCKENGIKGYSNKKKSELLALIEAHNEKNVASANPVVSTITTSDKLRMIDLFAGTGAFTLALEETGKVKCVFANDMVEESKVAYDLNFEHKLTLKDIHSLDIATIPPHDILTGGFPCFIAGTKVLTSKGYKNIEDIRTDEQLLTHTGKFQNILNLQRKKYTGNLYTISIKYHAEDIVCTDEHPFYVRTKHDKEFSKPVWKKASELTKNDYYGMVINTKSIIPEFTFERKINTTTTELITKRLDDKDMWFMMGYFVGDGWIQETKKTDGRPTNIIRFAINNKDECEIVERIRNILPITDKQCDTGKCKKFGCGNLFWFNILKMFGKYAHGKLIPEWVHDAPKEYIEEFIHGYMKADGYINKEQIYQMTTVSYDLAYSLQRLYLKLGYIFSINKTTRPKTTMIQNRLVNQRDTYMIRGKLQACKHSSFIEDNYVWFAPDKITIHETTDTEVYNFEVDIDNSYIVDNTVVHNCQPFSIAGKQLGFEDSRSNVFWAMCKILEKHQPKCFILENVKNLLSHDDGNTFKVIKENLMLKGYHIQYKVLNTAEITGVPQHRERIYIVGFKSKALCDKFSLQFSEKEVRSVATCFAEEGTVPEKYYYKETSGAWDLLEEAVTKRNTIYQYRRVYVRENKSGLCPTLTANMGSGGHNVPIVLDEKGIRKLTPRECFNFQGFPESYRLPAMADSHLYKLAGNAVSVPVVRLIAQRLIPLLLEEM